MHRCLYKCNLHLKKFEFRYSEGRNSYTDQKSLAYSQAIIIFYPPGCYIITNFSTFSQWPYAALLFYNNNCLTHEIYTINR